MISSPGLTYGFCVKSPFLDALNKSITFTLPFSGLIFIFLVDEYSVNELLIASETLVSPHTFFSFAELTSPVIFTVKTAGETKTN